MQKWAQGLRQWSLWLVGEGSTPDRSAGLMLGATVAVVALLGAGAAFALKSPSPSKPTTARSADAALYKAALAHKKVTRHQTTTTTQPRKKKTSRTVVTRRERAAEYQKALALAASDKAHHRVRRAGAKVRVKHAHHHVNTGAYKENTQASAAPASPPVDTASASAAPDIPSTLLDPVSLAPSPAAPAAPTIIGTASGSAGTRVTWSAPTDGGSSPVSGYNLYMGVSPGAQYTTPVNGSQPISGRSFVVTHVIAGTTYSFTVRAINAVRISSSSNQLSTVPPVSYQPVGQLAAPVVAMASNRWGTGY
ncbi:MAG: fibronectin type III domain-containing protein, partial [Acidimicrobiales bacterium]